MQIKILYGNIARQIINILLFLRKMVSLKKIKIKNYELYKIITCIQQLDIAK